MHASNINEYICYKKKIQRKMQMFHLSLTELVIHLCVTNYHKTL